MKRWLPIAIPALLALWIAGSLLPPKQKPDQFASELFGRLPVLANGRIQPIDSLARNSLLQLREKQTANTAPWKGNPKMLAATDWIMEVMMKPETADALPVFRIDNPDLKGLLGLPMDADKDKKTDGKHYSWAQIRGKLEALQDESMRAGKVDSSKRTPYDQAVVRLSGGVGLYMRLQNALQPQNARDWPAELNAYLNGIPAGVDAARAQKAGKEYNKEAFDGLMRDLERFDAMSQLEPPMLVPPADPEASRDGWQNTGAALMDAARGAPVSFAVAAYARMSAAYRAGNVGQFNEAVSDYRNAMAGQLLAESSKAANEQFFNRFEPFYKAMFPYIAAFLFVLIFWMAPATCEWARRTAVNLVLLGLLVHTAGLVFRMVLQGRPPVTNLYSSAIFIGFGAVILGLVLESIWKNGIGLVISSALGFVSLIIAHHLSLDGDTMEMMRAVLDTNFWLATHVVVVTLGYASTFVAGFLAVLYVLLGTFTNRLHQPMTATAAAAASLHAPEISGPAAGVVPAAKSSGLELGKSLTKMVYGVICFATLFSFVGTVLGGIWADQSWGRFWGWDPKENGALIIVLWNALILHARWGGLVRDRGLMCMAIFGNIVTAWSWFGVNMLGIGLHSYGFTAAAFVWLLGFALSQVLLICVGLFALKKTAPQAV